MGGTLLAVDLWWSGPGRERWQAAPEIVSRGALCLCWLTHAISFRSGYSDETATKSENENPLSLDNLRYGYARTRSNHVRNSPEHGTGQTARSGRYFRFVKLFLQGVMEVGAVGSAPPWQGTTLWHLRAAADQSDWTTRTDQSCRWE